MNIGAYKQVNRLTGPRNGAVAYIAAAKPRSRAFQKSDRAPPALVRAIWRLEKYKIFAHSFAHEMIQRYPIINDRPAKSQHYVLEHPQYGKVSRSNMSRGRHNAIDHSS